MNKKLAKAIADYIRSKFPYSLVLVLGDDGPQKNKRRKKYERRMERQKLTPKQPKRKQRW